VTPGRTGEHLGLPVLPSVRQAVDELKPDATGVYVAAHQAAGAIEEAIEAEIPLIVAVAEHIPLHDILRVGGFPLCHKIHVLQSCVDS
jgi:succinyl-CoA synthetase alpha subunit